MMGTKFRNTEDMGLPANIQLYDGNPEQRPEEDVLVLDETGQQNKLVLYNDDVHTFDYVIECLIEICLHSFRQAEQCTLIVHYKGKCTVKTGSMELLKPMHEKLTSRDLTSEIV